MDIRIFLIMTVTSFVIVLFVLEAILRQLANIGGLFGGKWYNMVLSIVAIILLVILELVLADVMLELFNKL